MVDNIIFLIIEGILLFAFVSVIVLFTTYYERKILADMQSRLGPMETGGRRFHGILQPIADVLKLLGKEDIIPKKADRLVYMLAPAVLFAPVFMMLSILPVDESIVISNLGIGILFILALSAIEPIGMIMAGWSSENKYTLLSALRSGAQMMTHGVPMILAVLGIILVTGTLDIREIVHSQEQAIFGFLPRWNIFLQPLGFAIFFIVALAELGRTPFDIIEAESEIISGYNIEYSGIRYSFFVFAEYTYLFVLSALMTLLFFGGWNGPILPGIVWFFIKTFLIIYAIIWIRATLPRIRIDQLLSLGWKYLIPLALLNIAITGGVMAIV